MILNGFSGSITNQAAARDIIAESEARKLNAHRISFNPVWVTGGSRPYNPAIVDYLLDNSDLTIIVDRNHHTSQDTVDWAQAESSLMECLNRWGNNPRIILEIINEFVHDGQNVWDRCEPIIQRIKAAGYSNKLLINKHTLADDWRSIEADFYGHHAYFSNLDDPDQDYNTLWQAKAQMNNAIAVNCLPLVNTETGAHHQEANHFTAENVAILNEYLDWCKTLSIGNMLWMNRDLNNLAKYEALGLEFIGGGEEMSFEYMNEDSETQIYKVMKMMLVEQREITIDPGETKTITLSSDEVLVRPEQ